MKVIYRAAVEEDLANIYQWIARDDVAAARAVVDRIIQNAERLGRHPKMGRTGKVPGTFEWVVPRLPYILVYTTDIENDILEVIAVFHTRRDR